MKDSGFKIILYDGNFVPILLPFLSHLNESEVFHKGLICTGIFCISLLFLCSADLSSESSLQNWAEFHVMNDVHR